MKKFLLALVFILGFASLCFASTNISFEIIAKDIDSNGNIRIWTTHSIDGTEIPSAYPKINGHFVYATRYNKQNFKGLTTKTDIENYILNDIKNYSSNLIQKEFDKTASKTIQQIKIDYNTTANQTFANTSLDKLVGKKLTVTETSEKLDINNDGVLDTEIIIKPDGTKTIKNYTP